MAKNEDQLFLESLIKSMANPNKKKQLNEAIDPYHGENPLDRDDPTGIDRASEIRKKHGGHKFQIRSPRKESLLGTEEPVKVPELAGHSTYGGSYEKPFVQGSGDMAARLNGMRLKRELAQKEQEVEVLREKLRSLELLNNPAAQ